MSATAQKRLSKELQKFKTQQPADMWIESDKDMTIVTKIRGPRETFWQDNIYSLQMVFKATYPMTAPDVRFMTPIFHPNVYQDGRICLDILSGQWSPIYGIEAILTSIRSLLCDPNPDSPANGEAARLYNENKAEYQKRNVQQQQKEKEPELTKQVQELLHL